MGRTCKRACESTIASKTQPMSEGHSAKAKREHNLPRTRELVTVASIRVASVLRGREPSSIGSSVLRGA